MSGNGPLHPERGTAKPGAYGIVSRNALGSAAPDRAVRRSIGEALRNLLSGEDLGKALLAIAAGRDPFKTARKKNPDGVPELGGPEVPIDWAHRMAALKLFAEYAHGKPAQSVIVQAEIDQRIALEGRIQTGPVNFGSMPPEVRAALRLAAAAALGQPLPMTLPARLRRAIDVDATPVPERVESSAQGTPEGPGERTAPVSLDDILAEDVDGAERTALELAPRRALELGVKQVVDGGGHGQTVEQEVAAVKGIHLDFRGSSNLVDAEVAAVKGIHLDFRGSSNLVDASLDNGVCTVRFRGSDGEPLPRTYRYGNVTPEMMAKWREAPSAGAWFAREIRQRHQQYPVLPSRTGGVVI